MTEAHALPALQEIFNELLRGGHISTMQPTLYDALSRHQEDFTTLFAALGFRLEHHPRGFFYFQGELKGELPKSVRQMALFVYILIEHLGEQARDLEAEFFDTEFTLEGLPHAKKDRYVELLEDLDVPATPDGLWAVVGHLANFGFAEKLGEEGFRFLPPAYRFLEQCRAAAAAADAAAEEEEA